jgi:hypothetical protein
MQKYFVPVLDKNNKSLMPTTPSRARQLLKTGRAVKRFFKGLFAIKLLDRDGGDTQPICVGIDPGSKREGFTVKSESHTYLNVQTEAIEYVKDNVETRRTMRRGRRHRKTPYRKCRSNRKIGSIPPSTKARWQWKLRILNWLSKVFPIDSVCVEDIKAETKEGKRRWNRSFSPLEVGKQWFYGEIEKRWKLHTMQGYETKQQRDVMGLKKTSKKVSEVFEAHCVDSWVLANSVVGGHTGVENKEMLIVKALRFFRRQLHVLQVAKGSIRKNYGSTISEGFKRGSIVTHLKYGLTFIGGASKGRVSLHNITDGKRQCQNAKPSEVKFLAYNSWITRTAYGSVAAVSSHT